MAFRPRFSLRMLAILVTVVCAYFGAWEATKTHGVPMMSCDTVNAPGPFILIGHKPLDMQIGIRKSVHIWLPKAAIKLVEWDEENEAAIKEFRKRLTLGPIRRGRPPLEDTESWKRIWAKAEEELRKSEIRGAPP